jgi:hypothetical protein
VGKGMERKERTKYRIAIFGLLTALIFTLTGFAISAAEISLPDGTVQACYRPNNGKLRLEVTGCNGKRELPITLGQPPKSYKASSDATVPLNQNDSAPQTIVATASIPAGTYLVNASVTFFNEDAPDPALPACRVQASTGDKGKFQYTMLNAGVTMDSMTVIGRLTLTAPGTLSLNCAEASGASPSVTATEIAVLGEAIITALRV